MPPQSNQDQSNPVHQIWRKKLQRLQHSTAPATNMTGRRREEGAATSHHRIPRQAAEGHPRTPTLPGQRHSSCQDPPGSQKPCSTTPPNRPPTTGGGAPGRPPAPARSDLDEASHGQPPLHPLVAPREEQRWREEGTDQATAEQWGSSGAAAGQDRGDPSLHPHQARRASSPPPPSRAPHGLVRRPPLGATGGGRGEGGGVGGGD